MGNNEICKDRIIIMDDAQINSRVVYCEINNKDHSEKHYGYVIISNNLAHDYPHEQKKIYWD